MAIPRSISSVSVDIWLESVFHFSFFLLGLISILFLKKGLVSCRCRPILFNFLFYFINELNYIMIFFLKWDKLYGDSERHHQPNKCQPIIGVAFA